MAVPTIGKYRIERLIKRGGMGAVYLGFDPELRRPAAIKVLRDNLDGDDLRERFRREAIAIAALRHPNIVTIFHADVEEGRPYIAMEYVPGETLADLIRRDALPLGRKLQIVEDVCGALGAAHRAGIVHRDIKPANILVDHDGTVKVVDFGIARTPDATLTQLGVLVGTLDYMAPEQLTDRAVDGRTDIFAVGVLLYELLANRRPFPGDFHATLAARVHHRDPIPLSDVYPEIDAATAAIVAMALEHDPARRYQDVQALREDLTAARLRLSAVGDETVVSPRACPPAPSTRVSGRLQAFPWRATAVAGATGLTIVLAAAMGVDPLASDAGATRLPLVRPPAPPTPGASLPPVAPVSHIPAPPAVRSPAAAAPPVEGPGPKPSPPPADRPVTPPPLRPGPSGVPGASVESPTPSVPGAVESGAVDEEPPRTQAPAPVAPPGQSPLAPPAVPTPVSVPAASERRLVRDAVERYMQAMSDRNLTAMAELRSLDPAMRAAMEAQFRELRSWKVTLADPFVSVNLDAATAMVTGRIKYQDVRSRDDRRGRVKDQNVTIELRKTAGAWLITGID